MLIVTGYMHVDPCELARFSYDLRVLATVTRLRPGNISYDVAVDDPEAGRLLVVERWKDQPSLSGHLSAVDTVAFIHRWHGRMRGDIRKYDAANERDIEET
jgi:quinol monooxygenase YgiN